MESDDVSNNEKADAIMDGTAMQTGRVLQYDMSHLPGVTWNAYAIPQGEGEVWRVHSTAYPRGITQVRSTVLEAVESAFHHEKVVRQITPEEIPNSALPDHGVDTDEYEQQG